MDMVRDATSFILKILPDMPEHAIKPKSPSEMNIKELLKAIKSNGLAKKAVGLSEKHEYIKLLEDFYSSR